MCWFQSELDVLVHDSTHNPSSSPLSADTKQTFDRWYSDQMTSSASAHHDNHDDDIISDDDNNNENNVDHHRHPNPTSPVMGHQRRLSNGHTGTPGGRGHARTWFDPVNEIPRLQRWLRLNSHPSRADMARYARELNAGPHRQTLQGRTPLDVNNVAYWFKNARARGGAGAPRVGHSPRRGRHVTSNDVVSRGTPPLNADHFSGHHTPPSIPPELPNSNAIYVVSPLCHVTTDDVIKDDSPRRKRRRLEVEPMDENHNERSTHHQRCTSSLSSASSSLSSYDDAGLRQQPEDEATATATDLTLPRRHRRHSCSGSSLLSLDEPPKTEQDEGLPPGNVQGGGLHLALGSTTTTTTTAGAAGGGPPQSLSLPLQVQQALQVHQIQQLAAMQRYMQHPSLYPAAQRWLGTPWLLPGKTPDDPNDTDSSGTACSTTSATAAVSLGACDAPGAGELQRRKRSRVFIDPLSEIPRLEAWFAIDSHPSSAAVERLTDELNRSPYRQRFPPLEPKNVQLWFKNHRAKVKRQSLESSLVPVITSVTSQLMNDDDDDVTDDVKRSLPSNRYSTPGDVTTGDEVVS